MKDPLPWSLLDKVARSFALTLRFLPGEVRESIALAYLLARISDTEADGVETPAEAELLEKKRDFLNLLEQSPDRDAIEKVWRTIQEGQAFDGARFSNAGACPLSREELDRYTYMVAGCVGEFWTDLCFARVRGFSRCSLPEMREMGIRYGKGLQLVNILRDRHHDLTLGRVYVPQDDFADILKMARDHLGQGCDYVRKIRPWRLRMATALPVLLGVSTLDLVEANPESLRVKVPRSEVWRHVWKAAWFRPD